MRYIDIFQGKQAIAVSGGRNSRIKKEVGSRRALETETKAENDRKDGEQKYV